MGDLPAGVISIDEHRRARARGSGVVGYACWAAARGVRITAAADGVADRAECPSGAVWLRPADDELGDTLDGWAHDHLPAHAQP